MRCMVLVLVAVLACLSSAQAFTNPTLLDDFNRADELGGAGGTGGLVGTTASCAPAAAPCWTTDITGTEASTLELLSNQVKKDSVAGDGAVYWNPTTFGPDTWASMDIPDGTGAAGNQIRLYARINSPTPPNAANTADAYHCQGKPDDATPIVEIYRTTNAGLSGVLASANVNIGDGSKFGIEVTGIGATVTVTCWVDVTGSGGWVSGPTFGDTSVDRIPTAGYVGFRANASAYAFDNFRACTVVAGACATAGPPPRAIIINHRCPFGLCRGEKFWAGLWRTHP
jgi:hypothetical protein